jgi:hypothetical protein
MTVCAAVIQAAPSARAPRILRQVVEAAHMADAPRGTAEALERRRHIGLGRRVVEGDLLAESDRADRAQEPPLDAGIRFAAVVEEAPGMAKAHFGVGQRCVGIDVQRRIDLDRVAGRIRLQPSLDGEDRAGFRDVARREEPDAVRDVTDGAGWELDEIGEV